MPAFGNIVGAVVGSLFVVELAELLAFVEFVDSIKSISLEDYDLICYHYGAGYSYHEISKITGVSSSALRKRMERCKSKLAKILDEEK